LINNQGGIILTPELLKNKTAFCSLLERCPHLMTLVLEGCKFKDGILQREKLPELAGVGS